MAAENIHFQVMVMVKIACAMRLFVNNGKLYHLWANVHTTYPYSRVCSSSLFYHMNLWPSIWFVICINKFDVPNREWIFLTWSSEANSPSHAIKSQMIPIGKDVSCITQLGINYWWSLYTRIMYTKTLGYDYYGSIHNCGNVRQSPVSLLNTR